MKSCFALILLLSVLILNTCNSNNNHNKSNTNTNSLKKITYNISYSQNTNLTKYKSKINNTNTNSCTKSYIPVYWAHKISTSKKTIRTKHMLMQISPYSINLYSSRKPSHHTLEFNMNLIKTQKIVKVFPNNKCFKVVLNSADLDDTKNLDLCFKSNSGISEIVNLINSYKTCLLPVLKVVDSKMMVKNAVIFKFLLERKLQMVEARKKDDLYRGIVRKSIYSNGNAQSLKKISKKMKDLYYRNRPSISKNVHKSKLEKQLLKKAIKKMYVSAKKQISKNEKLGRKLANKKLKAKLVVSKQKGIAKIKKMLKKETTYKNVNSSSTTKKVPIGNVAKTVSIIVKTNTTIKAAAKKNRQALKRKNKAETKKILKT